MGERVGIQTNKKHTSAELRDCQVATSWPVMLRAPGRAGAAAANPATSERLGVTLGVLLGFGCKKSPHVC